MQPRSTGTGTASIILERDFGETGHLYLRYSIGTCTGTKLVSTCLSVSPLEARGYSMTIMPHARKLLVVSAVLYKRQQGHLLNLQYKRFARNKENSGLSNDVVCDSNETA
jgi:hypothetical protein